MESFRPGEKYTIPLILDALRDEKKAALIPPYIRPTLIDEIERAQARSDNKGYDGVLLEVMDVLMRQRLFREAGFVNYIRTNVYEVLRAA